MKGLDSQGGDRVLEHHGDLGRGGAEGRCLPRVVGKDVCVDGGAEDGGRVAGDGRHGEAGIGGHDPDAGRLAGVADEEASVGLGADHAAEENANLDLGAAAAFGGERRGLGAKEVDPCAARGA